MGLRNLKDWEVHKQKNSTLFFTKHIDKLPILLSYTYLIRPLKKLLLKSKINKNADYTYPMIKY